MRVSIRHLTKRFTTTTVLDQVSIEVADRELFFLLGPSGCGKTTLLRLIAGFYQPDAGEIWFGDRLITPVPPHQRNTGMVFQNYALWPHLTVAQNVAYGLETRGVQRADVGRRVHETLEIVQMTAFADRSPALLSGGQQQRVALARALVIRPDVLLLDEPLSNLDAKLRLEMREEIRRIHDQTQITTIYVTHDQKESLSMADRLAVLRDGVVEQVGTPREVYCTPGNRFVAEFIGETNWLEAIVTSTSETGVHLQTPHGMFVAPPRQNLAPDQSVWIGFRPEAIRIGPHPVNTLTVTVSKLTYMGEVEQYCLALDRDHTIKACLFNPLDAYPPNTPLTVHIHPANVFVMPRATAASPPRPSQ